MLSKKYVERRYNELLELTKKYKPNNIQQFTNCPHFTEMDRYEYLSACARCKYSMSCGELIQFGEFALPDINKELQIYKSILDCFGLHIPVISKNNLKILGSQLLFLGVYVCLCCCLFLMVYVINNVTTLSFGGGILDIIFLSILILLLVFALGELFSSFRYRYQMADDFLTPTIVKKLDIYQLRRLGTIVDTWKSYKGTKDYKHYENSEYVLYDLCEVFDAYLYMPYLWMRNGTTGEYHFECVYDETKGLPQQARTIKQALQFRYNHLDIKNEEIYFIK